MADALGRNPSWINGHRWFGTGERKRLKAEQRAHERFKRECSSGQRISRNYDGYNQEND